MSNNKELYNVVGQLAKSVISDLVDKAVESTKAVGEATSDLAENMKESVSQKKTMMIGIPSETELMKLFIESYDGPITPSWNRVELRFVDDAVNREFIAFKNGYLAAYKG